MAFFHPGDVVTVRSDLERYKQYAMDDDRCILDSAVSEMLKLRGRCVTIRDCTYKYSIYETDWNWTDEMFQEYLDYKNGIGTHVEVQAITMDDIMSLLGYD